MTTSKTQALLFGVAAGLAVAAISIGLVLVGIAMAVDLHAGAASDLLQHPLFVSGSDLVSTGLVVGLPLFALWHFWMRQQR